MSYESRKKCDLKHITGCGLCPQMFDCPYDKNVQSNCKMETKTCEICGKTLPLSAFSKSYKGRCKECVARLTKEKRNGTATTAHKPIDWEQRRYEIAKEAVNGLLAAPVVDGIDPNPPMDDIARNAVKIADYLIKELKKGE